MMVKELVGQPSAIRHLSRELALKLMDEKIDFDFVAGNASAGMVLGWQLRNDLEEVSKREVPFVYIREQKKKGGQKERITGDMNNPLINPGDTVIVVEVEGASDIFSAKTISSAEALRKKGYEVNTVVTILPPNAKAKADLANANLDLTCYSTLPELAALLEKGVEVKAVTKPQFPYDLLKPGEIVKKIVDAGALEIRDLASGEEPFLYSSGLWGPGYLMIKGLVGQPHVMNELVWQLALKLKDKEFGFIIGNVTGGVIPGWQLRNYTEFLRGEEVPYVYAEGTRLLAEGLIEGRIVGDVDNPLINKDDRALVIEELVNTAGTTVGSAIHARKQGYEVNSTTTLFYYANPIAEKRFEAYGLDITFLVDLPLTLDLIEKAQLFNPRAVQDYRSFIADPMAYQKKWGLKPVKSGGTR